MITTMRLRTTEPYWLIKNGLLHTYPSLYENLKTDIVVVGAGITGALISHSLRNEGHKVVVIDESDVAFGSTSATTSMIQYEVDEMLIDLSDKIGVEGASLCYQAGVEAIADLQHLISREKIDCEFKKKDSLLMSHAPKATKKLKEEFDLRLAVGLPVKWMTAAQVKKDYGLKCYGAILSSEAASIDAYRLAHSLFFKNSKREKNPIRIYDQTPIEKVTETNRSVKIDLANGKHITCSHIVYCTGFKATEKIKEKIADLFDTYAVISEEYAKIPEKLCNTLVWDTNNPYLYMRTTQDSRILIGGEDSSFRMGLLRETLKKRKAKTLMKKLGEIAPQLNFQDDFSWSGTFAQTKDSLPYIGQPPEYKRSYFVLGFGGNGITYSIQAMKLLPLIMKGKTSALTEYYRFGR